MLLLDIVSLIKQPLSQFQQRIANRHLCPQCRVILRGFGGAHESDSTISIQQLPISFKSIEGSAIKGCPLCLLFLDGMSSHDKATLREQQDKSLSELGRMSGGAIDVDCNKWQIMLTKNPSILLYRSPKPIDPSGLFVFKRIHLAPSKELKPLIRKQHFSSSTESNSSWTVAKRWLNQCTTDHQLCAQRRNTFLPTRLIDIGTHTTISPRLLEPSEIVSGIKYATLSHCWGKHMPKKLQQDNLLSMKTKIEFSELSKTFQDAMQITKYLGLRYIWVDSLCIIQDSKEDWQREAGLMGQVYTNSACNISATGASDGSIGLFFDRNPLVIQPFRARFHGSQANGLFYLVNPSLWADGVDYSPLNRRAWVVQERLLSPCNLHFGSTQVYWECRQRLACEAYPVALPETFELNDCYRLDPEGGGARIRESHGLQADSSLDNYTLWGYIAATYTKGELSFESDKLVAISGIAEQMQKVLGDQYLAGLWRNHLADQLLWTAEYGRERTRKSTRQHEYRAPTWSWASIDGEIGRLGHIRYSDDRGIMIDILAARVDLATASPFGQITGAFLQVKGKLAKAAMYVSTEPGSIWSFGVYVKTLCKADFHVFQDVAFEQGTEISADFFDNLYCLPVRSPTVYPAGDFGIRGLLLQATGKRAGEFKRFGAFSVIYQKDDMLLANACEYFDSQAESCGFEYSSDDEGGYKYIITIV